MKRHFADLEIGERFRLGDRICEKIEPVYTKHKNPRRRRLLANFRDVRTGAMLRGRPLMVEVVDKG